MRDAYLHRGLGNAKLLREDLALRFLRGEGIEIGAMDYPLRTPRGAHVRYVDHLDEAGLRSAYAENLARGNPLVVPDIVDDGATLSVFADASLDFIVANHVFEHFEDPIAALENHLRVLRPGGVLFMTLPDARHTFDSRRPRTSLEHLLRDHRDGPRVSRRAHYEECARLIEGHTDATVEERIREMETNDIRPHFHVWEPITFVAFLSALELPFSLELLQASESEFLVVLRKEQRG
ncbi:MAG: class I SAM-dependent methyltransferase [Actinomycetota bacterium]|nr:class I SAM-dependent methyltransferase [Actinomycetota bacterium]